jgi:hypothetical protein
MKKEWNTAWSSMLYSKQSHWEAPSATGQAARPFSTLFQTPQYSWLASSFGNIKFLGVWYEWHLFFKDLNSNISDRDLNHPQSQCQILRLACAIVQALIIIILDEVISAVDKDGKKKIYVSTMQEFKSVYYWSSPVVSLQWRISMQILSMQNCWGWRV